MQALDFIEHNKNDFGIRRTKRLPVSGAFHTDLMKPAVQLFKEALKDVTVERPRVPVYSNVDNQGRDSLHSKISQRSLKNVGQSTRCAISSRTLVGLT